MPYSDGLSEDSEERQERARPKSEEEILLEMRKVQRKQQKELTERMQYNKFEVEKIDNHYAFDDKKGI